MAIKINIGSLKDGSQQLELRADAKEIGLDENLVKDSLNITLNLHKTVHQLDIRADVSGVLNMECDRCLEVFERSLETNFELVYVQKTAREEEINEDYIKNL